MSKKRRPKIVMGLANPERVRADQERRRSGAAGVHKSKWEQNRAKIRQQLRQMRKCDMCEG